MNKCLLKCHNFLGLNNGLYTFDKFFSTSSFSFFLEIQETCGSLSKLLFIKPNKLGCILKKNFVITF